MWHSNQDVVYTYSSSASSTCYAYLAGLGWKRIKTGSPDGVTNIYMQMNAARANNRKVHVQIDGNNQITAAYLL